MHYATQANRTRLADDAMGMWEAADALSADVIPLPAPRERKQHAPGKNWKTSTGKQGVK
jgi:hypothetical protein